MAKAQEKELVTEQSTQVAKQEKPKKIESFTQKEEFNQSESLFIITLMNKGNTMKEAKEACLKHRELKPKSKMTDSVNLIKQRAEKKEAFEKQKVENDKINAEKKAKEEKQKQAEAQAVLEKNKEAREIDPSVKDVTKKDKK